MRLNRGTIVLVVALLVVVVGALLISNQQASAPGTPTATPNPESGPLFATIENGGVIARYELREAAGGTFIELNRLDAQNWSVAGSAADASRTPESSLIETTAGQLADIEYTTSFESDDLASFGLTNPQYVVYVETGTGDGYTLYIGAKTPTNPRYYAVIEPGIAAPAPAAESTAEAIAAATVEATVEAEAPADATAEATVEADADATAEMTDAVVAATRDPLATDVFANLLNPTSIPSRPAAFTLSGTKTIYVIPQTVLNTLTGWLINPPYQPPPTATPLPSPTLESTVEVTAETTAEATSEATPEAEVTAEAMAES